MDNFLIQSIQWGCDNYEILSGLCINVKIQSNHSKKFCSKFHKCIVWENRFENEIFDCLKIEIFKNVSNVPKNISTNLPNDTKHFFLRELRVIYSLRDVTSVPHRTSYEKKSVWCYWVDLSKFFIFASFIKNAAFYRFFNLFYTLL